jgi:cytochrome c oxidase subunit 4
MNATVAARHEWRAGARVYSFIWIWLLVLTGLEVWLAYIHFTPAILIVLLMGLSVTKAGLIMAYFMHLRFERANLIFSLVPALVVCIALLFAFFPDSWRALDLRVR